MPLKITKGSEPIEVKNVKVMLYGQPGIGKTSSAFTASNVLLLDCDNGAYRSNFRKDSVRVSNWEDIANITGEDLEPYDTIAIDTVGRLLDFLSADIMKKNPKMGFNGALTLQGYGQLKSQFATWVKLLTTMGIDVIMIAHDKEDKRGDETVVRPDIQGGSYGEVFKIADAVGYMYRGEHGNMLDFNPTTTWEGKNVAALDPIKIPDFRVEPDFFAGLLVTMKEAMNTLSEEGKMIADMVAKHREEIAKMESAEDINKAIEGLPAIIDVAQAPVKKLIFDRANTLGLAYDKKAGKYLDQSAEPESQEQVA